MRRNDFAEIKRTEIDVLPVGKIRRLLETALEHDPALLPLFLVETFCGIRPAEAARIQWTDLDLLCKRLTIRASVSKTGTARSIACPLCARLVRSLQSYRWRSNQRCDCSLAGIGSAHASAQGPLLFRLPRRRS